MIKKTSQFEQVCELYGLAGAFVYSHNGENPDGFKTIMKR